MAAHAVEATEVVQGLLQEMLQKAQAIKPVPDLEPALQRSDVAEWLKRMNGIDHFANPQDGKQTYRYAVIDTAARIAFNKLVSTLDIEQLEFVKMWDFLDIMFILGDDEVCDPALGFWLVEELLDSQTIAGCGKVFDYLESRRERITAKHFKQKELAILRSCKELLRRLSRAEDTAFCGRVYVFMFQSFPLGDKSSVNLRGEYHVENITTYDEFPAKVADAVDRMEVDSDPAPSSTGTDVKTASAGLANSKSGDDSKALSKSVTFDAKAGRSQKALDPEALYPIFWSLQQDFSQPKRLFDQSRLNDFKRGWEATMVMFKSLHKSVQNEWKPPLKSTDDGKKGLKRKRGQSTHDLATAFNPKYLTSRDLFELELSDISFRRHILIQALIIMDFLISLSAKAKEKLANIKVPNKSVMYQEQILSEEDIQWATDMKETIIEYLKSGSVEGAYYTRMVESVISRDKNWVRWKVESCPSIERPAISPAEYLSAKDAARKATASKRLRPKPMGSLDLAFLSEVDTGRGMEKLRSLSKHHLPALDSFKNKIALDDMEIEMPTNDESKEAAINGKASKSWRALRIASKIKLSSFDKIEDPERIDIIFDDEPLEADELSTNEDTMDDEPAKYPTDRRPIVAAGLGGVGLGELLTMLVSRHPKVLGKSASHTVRPSQDGEVDGVHHYFVDQEKFNLMRDGDQFLEFGSRDGSDYGTSRKILDTMIAGGKVPIVETDFHGVQQLKDQSFPARYVFVEPPSLEELENRLRTNGEMSEERIKERLSAADDELKAAQDPGYYDKVIVNHEVEASYAELEDFIYESSASMESENAE